MKKYLLGIVSVFLLPAFVFAAAPGDLRDVAGLFLKIMLNVTNILIALLTVGIAYGVVVYFANSDNEKKREEIKGYLLWSIIGIVVVFGIWGIVSIMRYSVFGTSSVGIIQISPPTP